MADDIIGERGKFGLDIRKKKKLVGRCLHPWRFQASPRYDQAALLATVLFQERGWSRDHLRPPLPTCPCGSEPWFLQCHSTRCSSLLAVLLVSFWLPFCCFGLQVCAVASVLPSSPEKNSRDSENPSVLLWLGPTCQTPRATWVGCCAECVHSRGKGWLRQEVVLPLS